MPIYEYVCERCEETSEFLEKAGGNGSHNCDHCGCKKMRKAFSSFAARTKGSSGGHSSAGRSGCASCRAGSCAGCRH